ncbi:cell surface glycoprotein CD200 receptor 1 isoform X3 [Echeneis naucrates]|uniref:cell surface glycoprotein CD200 receptor 1 isoform X3 n=1 Tax=Echeneis naucrates TaxID=173247 RepID=UPI001113E8DC|nr:cell surface glycoprotein CD200 receptor 1 isoform X3 [Echeneis naucrates]
MKEALEWQLYRPAWLQLKTRDTMWIYVAMIFGVSGAWSPETVTKNLSFNVGSDVNLTCSDKTWNETIYVIWKIQMSHKSCRIAFSNGDDGVEARDSCNDGKSLHNTSRSQPYLRIPSFSINDIGAYNCELAYNGGMENYVINVSITVPPKLSSRLYTREKKFIAVCKAERGKPAANISWSHGGNSAEVETLPEPDGLITVQSHLVLDLEPENLTCSFRHLFWEEEQILSLKPEEDYIQWVRLSVVVVITAFFVGLAFFCLHKIKVLRLCQQSDISSSKSPTTEDVEEVEPYASYVERVNSIYN